MVAAVSYLVSTRAPISVSLHDRGIERPDHDVRRSLDARVGRGMRGSS
jgi:hypothetical protein